jgi:hypothetical protein
MPNTCAHFKEAHDLTVDLTSFSGDAHLTVLPYPDMAEGDTVAGAGRKYKPSIGSLADRAHSNNRRRASH